MKILVADDHPIVLSGIKSILRDTRYEVVGTAADGEETIAEVDRLRPDVLILDVQMPGLNGIEVIRTLRGRGDRRPVILLTASLDDRRLLDALALGVEGIVLKEGAEHLLVRCLDEVSAGRRWIDHGLMQQAMELKTGGGPPGGLGTLSPRERDIAALIAQGKRNREIADRLGITEGTVKIHLHRVYEKLGVSNRTELAVLIRDPDGG